MILWVAVFIVVSGVSCSNPADSTIGRDSGVHDSGVKVRVFTPPSSRVRAVPPHHIHGKGMGPYELGAPMNKILSTLPHGPRLELFRLGTLADFSLARSEAGALLIGIDREVGVTFVAAVRAGVARTEHGVGVGSDISSATKEFGRQLKKPLEASDPRLVVYEKLPSAIFITDDSNSAKGDPMASPPIVAILTEASSRQKTRPARKHMESPPRRSDGNKPDGNKPDVDVRKHPEASGDCKDLGLAKRLRNHEKFSSQATVVFDCADAGAEITAALIYDGDRLSWIEIDRGKIRRMSHLVVDGLRFAAPIKMSPFLLKARVKPRVKPRVGLRGGEAGSRAKRVGEANDGPREEGIPLLVSVSERRSGRELTIHLEVYRTDGPRLVSVGSKRLYTLSADEISWVGGTLPEVSVPMIIRGVVSTDGALSVMARGIYLHQRAGKVTMVAPLNSRTLPLSFKRKPNLGNEANDGNTVSGIRDRDGGVAAASPSLSGRDAGLSGELIKPMVDAGPVALDGGHTLLDPTVDANDRSAPPLHSTSR